MNAYKKQAAVWLIRNGYRKRDVCAELAVGGPTIEKLMRAEGITDKRWRNGGDRLAEKDRHGTNGCYRSGCRCRACTDANTERLRKAKALRVERFRSGVLDPPHGLPQTYSNYDCRCDECRAAWSEHMKRRRDTRERHIHRVHCPICDRLMSVRSDGRIRAHRDNDREPCPGSRSQVAA